MPRKEKRHLADAISVEFDVSFKLALKAVEAGVHERVMELARRSGNETQAFIAAVNVLAR